MRGQQLSLAMNAVDEAGPGVDHGEVFTRRWVVELVLDLVGYRPDEELDRKTLIEPSCGTGAFLVPVIERLLACVGGEEIQRCGSAVRAFDLLPANAELARKAVVETLAAHGVPLHAAEALASEWVSTADFLLHDLPGGSADFVVGNPPYVRIESMGRDVMEAYRNACPTMRGRSDLYVGFLERGLRLLARDGALGYICADRWMHNQYGARLRELVADRYAVEAVLTMHDVDAFEHEVSAYPAVTVIRNTPQASAIVATAERSFDGDAARRFVGWAVHSEAPATRQRSYQAARLSSWFSGPRLWPHGDPGALALVADLERRFPPLQDPDTGTRVGIGVATGCDDVYITSQTGIVETDRLLPLVRSDDLTGGRVSWGGQFLVNPWDDDGLVGLSGYPRLDAYLRSHETRLRARHVARKRPEAWFRTIDRVNPGLRERAKLLLPDLKAAAHPVLDEGGLYPHHNLYYVVSDLWDLEVLGGLLLSDIANLFVGTYCVKMRGGCYRFQAQYLRMIRVPDPRRLTVGQRRALSAAFRARDRAAATDAALQAYGLAETALTGAFSRPGAAETTSEGL